MKSIKSKFVNSLFILFAVASLQACHTKKLVQKPAPVAEMAKPAPVVAAVQPKPVDKPTVMTPPPVAKPDYNFSNIQFEFNSGILKTDSYPVLDKAATEMKINPSVKFILKGYASIEGTEKHNMELSVDRANSVKSYLVNSGVNVNNILANGYGTKDPIADNDTETGKVLNRRVEIHLEN
jgi:OOP family OmpA-OmpF porin